LRLLQLQLEAMTMSTSKVTTNHAEIKKWVESRGGHPATVKRTEHNHQPGVLRIDYPGGSGEDTLEEVSWDSWFEVFEDRKLAFVCQDNTADGKISRFSKLVSRENKAD
jgi:hypothetical protein